MAEGKLRLCIQQDRAPPPECAAGVWDAGRHGEMKRLKLLKCTKTSLFYPSTSEILPLERSGNGGKRWGVHSPPSRCHPEMKHGARNMPGDLGLKMALKKTPQTDLLLFRNHAIPLSKHELFTAPEDPGQNPSNLPLKCGTDSVKSR